ncbi:MAG: YfhO family protein [Chloroflexi bacterium]|nr:YfhO family protein [Chloroflexota bacterium]
MWIDDVFYDLEHTSPLGAVTLTEIPDFQATHLGVVSYLTGTAELADGVPAAQMSITTSLGVVITRTLLVGEHTAEGLYLDGTTAHRQARIGHRWRDNDRGNDYISVLHLEPASQPAAISLRSLLPTGQVQLRGLTLIDARTGTSRVLSVNPAYKLVHSGDTKIYENLTVLPRAFVVHQTRRIENDRAALEAMLSPDFDPSREVILSEGSELHAEGKYTDVAITAYEPEQIQIRAELDIPGYLLLSETTYPGWEALVDGQPVPIYQADIYFKAVALDAGKHLITFRFNPPNIRIGLAISGLAWLAWSLFLAITITHIGRKAKSSV